MSNRYVRIVDEEDQCQYCWICTVLDVIVDRAAIDELVTMR